ncbi:MAG: hypothetical protein HYS41_00465 [Candidatus Omnitrophica bacterium]|nr:hypothetical protein [Candidatus Omnitrophota bacterium]
MKTPTELQAKQAHRVVTFLDRAQVDFLDKLGKDALFSTGVKFPRTRVISALIDLLRKANVSGEGLRSDQELEERLIRKLRSSTPEIQRLAGELTGGSHENPARLRG